MTVVGIVGGGQLGLMTAQAADSIGVGCRLLVRPTDESAAAAGYDVTTVDRIDEASLRAFASTVDVVTFDHEPVDLDAVEALQAAGVPTYPGVDVLRYSDKAVQRRAFAEAGLPVPRFRVVDASLRPDALAVLGATLGWPLVIKVPRGGYDGRGVWIADDLDAATDVLAALEGPIVIEERLELTAEVASLVVRSRTGEHASFPLVDTVQRGGICHEVIAPCSLSPALAARATELALGVADVVGVVGVLAVELFIVGDEVFVNEVAPRPHNSGHLTIEACTSSQYTEHLRAVLGQPLSHPALVVERAVMVNVLGSGPSDATAPLPSITAVPVGGPDPESVVVHLYGKTPRRGRKVGHVTATGHDRHVLLATAHAAAHDAVTDGTAQRSPVAERGANDG